MRFALIVLAVLGLEKRNQQAAAQLREAKAAYQQALATTGDFDCAAPEFDAVLKQFDDVPGATAAKAEARDFARRIREKRAAAAQHARALGAVSAPRPEATAPPSTPSEGAAPPAGDPAACKSARKRMAGFARARKKSGRPPVGQLAFQASGDVGYAPGAEPSAEEAALLETLKSCR